MLLLAFPIPVEIRIVNTKENVELGIKLNMFMPNT